jgi:periplasmic divalent cation tolerance protein
MLSLLYVPCPDMESAKRIATQLLANKHIACANILPGMVSLYHWNGALEQSSEVVLLLKTQPSHEAAARAATQALHPYEMPCILTLNNVQANELFGNWVASQLL